MHHPRGPGRRRVRVVPGLAGRRAPASPARVARQCDVTHGVTLLYNLTRTWAVAATVYIVAGSGLLCDEPAHLASNLLRDVTESFRSLSLFSSAAPRPADLDDDSFRFVSFFFGKQAAIFFPLGVRSSDVATTKI
jgi:hypothetical protein